MLPDKKNSSRLQTDEGQIIAQVFIHGNPRNRTIPDINGVNTVLELRRTGAVVYWDVTQNRMGYLPQLDSQIPPADLPHMAYSEFIEEPDHPHTTGPTLTNTFKSGTSRPYVDIDQLVRSRGGDPNHPLYPPGSRSTHRPKLK